MKSLFKKYLERNKIQFKFVQNFKELLRYFKSREYQGVFIDIDTNVKGDDLERLTALHQKLKYEHEYFRPTIYCCFCKAS